MKVNRLYVDAYEYYYETIDSSYKYLFISSHTHYSQEKQPHFVVLTFDYDHTARCISYTEQMSANLCLPPMQEVLVPAFITRRSAPFTGCPLPRKRAQHILKSQSDSFVWSSGSPTTLPKFPFTQNTHLLYSNYIDLYTPKNLWVFWNHFQVMLSPKFLSYIREYAQVLSQISFYENIAIVYTQD